MTQETVEKIARLVYESDKIYYERRRLKVNDIFVRLWNMGVSTIKAAHPDSWHEMIPELIERPVPEVDLRDRRDQIQMVKSLDYFINECSDLDSTTNYKVYRSVIDVRNELCHDIVTEDIIYDESVWG